MCGPAPDIAALYLGLYGKPKGVRRLGADPSVTSKNVLSRVGKNPSVASLKKNPVFRAFSTGRPI